MNTRYVNKVFVIGFILILTTLGISQDCDDENSITRVTNRIEGNIEYVIFDLKSDSKPKYEVKTAAPPFYPYNEEETPIPVGGVSFKKVIFNNINSSCATLNDVISKDIAVKDVKELWSFEGIAEYAVGYLADTKMISSYDYQFGPTRKVVLKFQSSKNIKSNNSVAVSDTNVDSIYIDLDEKKCKETIYSHVNSGFSCSGVGEYKLSFSTGSLNTISLNNTTSKDVGYSLQAMEVLVQANYGQSYVTDLNIRFGKKAEFRVQKVNAKNKPIALIFRVNADSYKWDDAKKANITTHKSSNLLVAKITDDAVCITDFVKPMKNQNIRARELADISNTKPCLVKE